MGGLPLWADLAVHLGVLPRLILWHGQGLPGGLVVLRMGLTAWSTVDKYLNVPLVNTIKLKKLS